VQAVGWWGRFEDRTGRDAPEFDPAVAPLLADTVPQPYRAPPKVGRNDPCPCGSGRKYKKCCAP